MGVAAPAITYAAPAIAAPALAAPAITYAAPAIAAPALAAPAIAAPALAAPAISYAAPGIAAPAIAAPAIATVAVPTVQHVQYTHHVPVAKTYTHTIPLGVQRQVYTTHHVGGVVAPAAVV